MKKQPLNEISVLLLVYVNAGKKTPVFSLYLFHLFILLDHPMNLQETCERKKIIATPTILGDTRAPPCLSG